MSGYVFQTGPVERDDPFDLSIDVQVGYAGTWYSLNDHFNFKITPEGFGTTEETWRRKEVTSDYFVGSYTVRSVADAVKRSWEVQVLGGDMLELQENIKLLKKWFGQDSYNVRWIANEYMETWLAERADFKIDMSHVYLHNCMAKMTMSFSTHPITVSELVL